MLNLVKPKPLESGNRIAVVSPSAGLASVFPHRYATGIRQFEDSTGLRAVEMAHTCADAAWLAENPQARADDLMTAFADPDIDGIIASIGGDDSIRLLRYLDVGVIRDNPKAFVGYSDNTVVHFACMKAGVQSFYGPTIMSGFAENGGVHRYMLDSFFANVMAGTPPGPLQPNTEGWTTQFLDWAEPANQQIPRTLSPNQPWNFLQGTGRVEGPLIGGCLEVLEWLRGTPVWPTAEQWEGAVLFLETSEEGVPPEAVTRALRVYAASGVLAQLSAILFGRPGGGLQPEQFAAYDEALLQVVREEEGLDTPIVSGMDFGHTDPILTLAYGARAAVDCNTRTLSIVSTAWWRFR